MWRALKGTTVWTQSQRNGDQFVGRRAGGITQHPRGVYERAFKPRDIGEEPLGTCCCCQPDSGKPTVRDERGAYGNVSYGRTRTPLHNRKGAGRKLSAYGCARCISTRQSPIRGALEKSGHSHSPLTTKYFVMPLLWLVRLSAWVIHVSHFISVRSCRRLRANGDEEHLRRSAIRRSDAISSESTSVAHSGGARMNLLTLVTENIQLADFI